MSDDQDEPITIAEIEARAARLLLWEILDRLDVTRAELEGLAHGYETSPGGTASQPALVRDHLINEKAAELLVDTLRRKAAGAPMNDNNRA